MKGKVGEWTPRSVGMPDEYESIFARYKGSSRWEQGMFSKKSDTVIITFQNKDVIRGRGTSYTVDSVWSIERRPGGIGRLNVIAWMPMPEPYEGGK